MNVTNSLGGSCVNERCQMSKNGHLIGTVTGEPGGVVRYASSGKDAMKVKKLIGALFLISIGVSWSPIIPQTGMRAVTLASLIHIRKLAEGGNYAQAWNHLDSLQAKTNTSSMEITAIGRIRSDVVVM